jgi:hypothetical protein
MKIDRIKNDRIKSVTDPLKSDPAASVCIRSSGLEELTKPFSRLSGTLVVVLQLSYSFHQKCSKLDTATTESLKKQ